MYSKYQLVLKPLLEPQRAESEVYLHSHATYCSAAASVYTGIDLQHMTQSHCTLVDNITLLCSLCHLAADCGTSLYVVRRRPLPFV